MVSVLLLTSNLFAALTEEQRVQDFQTLTAAYAKAYGPANWKLLALGNSIFDTAGWMKRVRAAKSDLEHLQVMMEYVGAFKDTHTALQMRSNFLADLGFYCDVYDGKAVIDTIDRAILPTRTYPFVVGDEFVSLDGRPALEVAQELEKVAGWGNPRAQLRYALQGVTLRFQGGYPLAVNLPDESSVAIKRQDGTLETYKIRWEKTGYPVRNLGSLGTPGALSSSVYFDDEEATRVEAGVLADRPARKAIVEKFQGTQKAIRNFRTERRTVVNDEGKSLPFESLRGFGARAPRWTTPSGFLIRLGRSATDTFYSGTYVADGLRIGYIRARNYLFYTNAGLNQLANEIVYMNNNTDGLVVDVMLNNGGVVCAAVEMAAMLIPQELTISGFSFRPSQAIISSFDAALTEAEFFGDAQHEIDLIRFQRDLLVGANETSRGMTGSLTPCFYSDFKQTSYAFAYQKPMIVLVDDFSTSAADLFPAMIQDNARGKLVGMRTNGAGGNVTGPVPITSWSELLGTETISMAMRSKEWSYEGFPKSPFIENVGVRPDVELDYMTVDNLLNAGRPFVTAFTKVIVDEIRAARP